MPICSFSPPMCGREALPDVRPHLCSVHMHLVICPTCEDWPVLSRRFCPTCHGPGLCSTERARWAVDTSTRIRSRERHPHLGDVRWGLREDAEPDPSDFGPDSPVDASMGEGGGYPPDHTPFVPSRGGVR